jgi:thiamine-monophosphate kinase
LANSAIDLSDGLISDLGHILKASGCGARVDLDAMPFSDAMLRQVEPEQALRWALSGGEDYELCFTVPELNRGALDVALANLGARFTCIGQIRRNRKVCSSCAKVSPSRSILGYDHFGA